MLHSVAIPHAVGCERDVPVSHLPAAFKDEALTVRSGAFCVLNCRFELRDKVGGPDANDEASSSASLDGDSHRETGVAVRAVAKHGILLGLRRQVQA
jgi:hypothetical protein